VDYNDVDFAALARVFGAHGERVEEPAGLVPALQRALESGLPAVIDVPIHPDFHAAVVSK
jgi:acetolactate synthase-1/2/3 large subunit